MGFWGQAKPGLFIAMAQQPVWYYGLLRVAAPEVVSVGKKQTACALLKSDWFDWQKLSFI